MKLTKQSVDTEFTQLLERWVSSGSLSERAGIQDNLCGYGEAFGVQMQLALQDQNYKDAAEQFLKECGDPRAIEWIAKQVASRNHKIASILIPLPASVMPITLLLTLPLLSMTLPFLNASGLVLVLGLTVCQFKLITLIMYRVHKALAKRFQLEALERIILEKPDPLVLQALCSIILTLHTPKEWTQWEKLGLMLSRVSEADRPLFTKQTIKTLFHLVPYMPEEVLYELCSAFAHIGDSSHIPALRAIARTSKSAQVKEAAQHCIATLQSANDIAQQSTTLLRASKATEQTDTLLRPAQHTNDDDTNQLLRPR